MPDTAEAMTLSGMPVLTKTTLLMCCLVKNGQWVRVRIIHWDLIGGLACWEVTGSVRLIMPHLLSAKTWYIMRTTHLRIRNPKYIMLISQQHGNATNQSMLRPGHFSS